MVNDDRYPSRSASRRSIRTHAEWNVDTHIFSATGPTRAPTRAFISSAALLVKVMARISNGDTPVSTRWAMRWVSTRVLPDPAPATMSSGPSWCRTASRWTGFSPSKRSWPWCAADIGVTLSVGSDISGPTRLGQHGRQSRLATAVLLAVAAPAVRRREQLLDRAPCRGERHLGVVELVDQMREQQRVSLVGDRVQPPDH